MDEAQGEIGALSWQAGSLLENDVVIIKSTNQEKLDVHDEDAEILAMLREEKIIVEQDLRSCFLTNNESSDDMLYSENLITNLKPLQRIESETPEKTSDLGHKAPGDPVLLKSLKVEIPDEQDEDAEILAMLEEEKIIIEQGLITKAFFLTNNESTDTLYSEKLVTDFKTEQLKSETPKKTSERRNKASGKDDAVLLKSPKEEIADEQDEQEEISAMLDEEEIILEQDLIKSCFSTDNESTADMLYTENLVTDSKTSDEMESETSEDTPDLGNKSSDADIGAFSTLTLPRGVIYELDNTFICNDCGEHFYKKTRLIQHIKSHNTFTSGYFKCPECDYRTLYRDTLDRHLRLHDKTRSHQCDVCGRTFTKHVNLQQHMKFQHSVDKETFKVHSCDVCVYKTSRLRNLLKHRKTHTGEKSFSCSVCGQKFVEKGHLNRHKRVHKEEKPFSCHMCTYQCSQESVLEKHIRSHTGVKPFSCSVCGRKFSQNCHLNRHMRVHTGEKPFSCHLCACKFSRKCSLKIHMRCHTEEKPFSCPVCGQKFSQNINLKRHVRVHTGEKPFSCSMCTYRCSQSQDLRTHMRVHTGEKPFSCHMCTFQCTQKNYLTKHLRVHTGEKPYSCSKCRRKFSEKSSLKAHMRSHTGEHGRRKKEGPCAPN